VCEAETLSPAGGAAGPAIEIQPDGPGDGIAAAAREPEDGDWRRAGAEELLRRLAGGGLVAARRFPEPLERWARRARDKGCRLLIANGVENQPFVTADHRLLAEQGEQVVRGLAILASATGARKAVLAVDRRRTGEYRALESAALAWGVPTVAVHPIYPIGNDTILVKVLARREVPLGGESLDAGAAVTDASTCFAAYRWVARGVPFTGRVVTVAGPAAARAGNWFVPLGTPCGPLAGAAPEAWLLHGGPMSGRLCGEATVVSACTDAVLAVGPVEPAVAAPCIRCGWCTDHCPARLNVSALNDLYELAEIPRAERLGALGCVECGVCTYICPARLPLSQRVKQLKRMIRPSQGRAPLSCGGGRRP
jgi:electron transport complex protein RnfC